MSADTGVCLRNKFCSGARGGRRGRRERVLAVPDHMLQSDENRNDDLFLFGLVDVDAVLVMQREHFLADDCNDIAGIVIQFKVQTDNVSAQLPAQTFNVGDVFDDMEQFVGQLKLLTICHCDIMALMQCPKFAFHMCYIMAVSIDNVGFVM